MRSCMPTILIDWFSEGEMRLRVLNYAGKEVVQWSLKALMHW